MRRVRLIAVLSLGCAGASMLSGCAGSNGSAGAAGAAGTSNGAAGTGTYSTGGTLGSGGHTATGGAGNPTATGGAATGGAATGGAATGGVSTGGMSATGGAGGHTVSACPTDSAAVGVWEQITPPEVPIPPPDGTFGSKSPVINPHDRSIVYLGTDHHGVFKSTDCGATWVKISTGKNGSVLATGAQWTMVMDPVDPNVLYANNGYGSEEGVFKTTNGGVDWEQTTPAGGVVASNVQYNFATRIAMDPTDRTHLVVSFHSNCLNQYAPSCVAETTDSGTTWTLHKMPVGGGEAAGIAMVDRKTWLFGVPFTALAITTDQGKTWSQIANDGGYTLYHASTGTYFLAGGAHGIFHSSDGVKWAQNQTGPFYAVVGDGTTLYASPRYCDTQCYFKSPETDGANWTAMTTPVKGHGAVDLAYDPDHHLLYSSNEGGGFWRVKLR